MGNKEDDTDSSSEGGSIIYTVQKNYEDFNCTVMLDFTNISVQKLKTSNASDKISASSLISSEEVLRSHSEGYDDPTSAEFNAPELPQANLFERLWQRTNKENEEFVYQLQVVVPKPNSSVRDSGYSTRRTVGQSTVFSQVGSKIIVCTNKYTVDKISRFYKLFLSLLNPHLVRNSHQKAL